jgi:hypothetical protein
MKLREWVFGGKDFKTMLDPEVYSDEEISRDKHKANLMMTQHEQDMNKHAAAYKRLIKEGAEAGELQRKNLAMRARMEKQRYNQKKQLFMMMSTKLAAVMSLEMAREMAQAKAAAKGQDGLVIDTVFTAAEAQQIHSQVLDNMTDLGVRNEAMEKFVDTLNIPIVSDEITDDSPELSAMERVAAGDRSADELDIEDEFDMEFDPTEMEVSDIDFDEVAG